MWRNWPCWPRMVVRVGYSAGMVVPTLPPERDTAAPATAAKSPLRSIAGAVAVIGVALAVLIVMWLSLSQRGHGVVGDAADGARIVVREVESTLDTNIIDRSDIPWQADEVAHLVGWGSITLAAGALLRKRRSPGEIAVAVFAASFGIEILQKLATSSRRMEAEDVSANALGVMLGLMVLVAAERILRAPRPSVVGARP